MYLFASCDFCMDCAVGLGYKAERSSSVCDLLIVTWIDKWKSYEKME